MQASRFLSREAAGGLGYIVLAAAVLALADGLVKMIGHTVSVWQLITLRAFVAVPLLAVFMMVSVRHGLRPKHGLWVSLRSLLLVSMWILVYLALTGLPLPTVSAALYTSPLLITLFCAAIPGRRMAASEIGAVVLGFVGVLILLRPGTSAFSSMLWLPLAAAALYALAALLTATRCRDESPLVMALGVQVAFLVVGSVGLAVLTCLPLPAGWQRAAPFVATGWHRLAAMDVSQVGWIIAALALIAVVASAAMGRAYQMAPVPLVAAGDYSYLVFSTLWSLLLFGHLPDVWGVIGMTLIAVAGLYGARRGPSNDGTGAAGRGQDGPPRISAANEVSIADRAGNGFDARGASLSARRFKRFPDADANRPNDSSISCAPRRPGHGRTFDA